MRTEIAAITLFALVSFGTASGAGSIKGASGTVWQEGTNYERISVPGPIFEKKGTVEVVEFFRYSCGYCYMLEPYLTAWDRGKPSYVHFTRVPVVWNEETRAYARFYYTLRSLGKIEGKPEEDLHHEIFDSVFRVGDRLISDTQSADTIASQVHFAERHGIPGPLFLRVYDSKEVAADVDKAEKLTAADRIDATPMIVVDGAYKTSSDRAGASNMKLLSLINDIAQYQHQGVGVK